MMATVMQNWKKHISWNKQNNNFTHDHTLLYISLPSLHDSNMKIPDVTLCGEHKHKEKTLFSFSWSLIQSFRIQLQKNLPKFDKLNKME